MKNIDNYTNFLNEGISSGVKKAREALADGKKVFARHTHPRLSGKEFEILSFSPTGAMAEVMWSDGKKPEDMASFNIDDKKIRVEESVNEGGYYITTKSNVPSTWNDTNAILVDLKKFINGVGAANGADGVSDLVDVLEQVIKHAKKVLKKVN